TIHALAHARLAARRDQARHIILLDEIVQVVVRLQNDAAAAPAVAAAGATLGDVSFAMERHPALAAVAGLRGNLNFVYEHESLPAMKPHIQWELDPSFAVLFGPVASWHCLGHPKHRTE